MLGGVLSSTVKSTLQVEELPELSVTLIEMGCEPRPTIVPAAGSCVIFIEACGVQLSLATTCEATSGTAAWQLASEAAVISPGQEPVGGVVSTTAMVTLAWLEAPQVSVTVRVSTLVPIGKEAVITALVPRTELPKLQAKVSGSLSGSLEAEPFSVTVAWQSTVWLGPGTATGGLLPVPRSITNHW